MNTVGKCYPNTLQFSYTCQALTTVHQKFNFRGKTVPLTFKLREKRAKSGLLVQKNFHFCSTFGASGWLISSKIVQNKEKLSSTKVKTMDNLYCPICYEPLKQSFTGETYCPEGCYCSSGSRLEPLTERQHLEKHIAFYRDRVRALEGKIRDMQYKLDRMD